MRSVSGRPHRNHAQAQRSAAPKPREVAGQTETTRTHGGRPHRNRSSSSSNNGTKPHKHTPHNHQHQHTTKPPTTAAHSPNNRQPPPTVCLCLSVSVFYRGLMRSSHPVRSAGAPGGKAGKWAVRPTDLAHAKAHSSRVSKDPRCPGLQQAVEVPPKVRPRPRRWTDPASPRDGPLGSRRAPTRTLASKTAVRGARRLLPREPKSPRWHPV